MTRYYGRKPYISSHDDYISFKNATTEAEIKSVAGEYPKMMKKKPYHDGQKNYSEMLHYFDGIKNLNISRKEGTISAQSPFVASVVPYVAPPTSPYVPTAITKFTVYCYYSLNGTDWTALGSLYNPFSIGCAFLWSSWGAGATKSKIYNDDFTYLDPPAMTTWNDTFTGDDADPPNATLWYATRAQILSNALSGTADPSFFCESKGTTTVSSTFTVKTFIDSTVGAYAYSGMYFGPPLYGTGITLADNSIGIQQYLDGGVRKVITLKIVGGETSDISTATIAEGDNTVYFKLVWM